MANVRSEALAVGVKRDCEQLEELGNSRKRSKVRDISENAVLKHLEDGLPPAELTIVQLKVYLRKEGLRLTGNKAELVIRVQQHFTGRTCTSNAPGSGTDFPGKVQRQDTQEREKGNSEVSPLQAGIPRPYASGCGFGARATIERSNFPVTNAGLSAAAPTPAVDFTNSIGRPSVQPRLDAFSNYTPVVATGLSFLPGVRPTVGEPVPDGSLPRPNSSYQNGQHAHAERNHSASELAENRMPPQQLQQRNPSTRIPGRAGVRETNTLSREVIDRIVQEVLADKSLDNHPRGAKAWRKIPRAPAGNGNGNISHPNPFSNGNGNTSHHTPLSKINFVPSGTVCEEDSAPAEATATESAALGVAMQVEPKFADFEDHTTGYGSRMLAKWGFVAGSGLGKEGTGIAQFPVVVQRPKLLGLGAPSNQYSAGPGRRANPKSSFKFVRTV